MTEKRFIPIFDGTDKRVVGAKDNGKIISFMDMFDLLNDLSEENEKLKKDCSNLIDDNTEYVAEINQMHKENEELKKEIKQLKNKIKTYNSTHELLKETIDRLRSDG